MIKSTNHTQTNNKGTIKHFSKLFGYLKPYRLAMVGAFIALLITSSSVLALGRGVQFLVDEGFSQNNPELLNKALIVVLAVAALLAIATFARYYLVNYVGENVVKEIRKDVFKHVVKLSPGFFETNRTGEILSRITTDTSLVQSVIASTVSVALRNIVMLTGGIILLTITSPKLTGYVFILVPLVVGLIVMLGRRVRGLSRQTQDKIADIAAQAEESLSGIKTVQSYVREKFESDHFAGKVVDAYSMSMRRVGFRSVLVAIVIMTMFGSIGAVLWVGGHDVLQGKMSPGALVSFVFYSLVVAGAVGALSEVTTDLQRAAGAVERLFELMAVRSDIKDPPHPHKLPKKIKGNIHFDEVTFHYPARPKVASLEAFSLDVAPGETVALVGASGAGKTTVLQMLMRFYDPKEGTIKVDGVDIKSLKLKDLRSIFGYVPQEHILFSGTVYENISYGKQDATEAEIKEAAVAAAALEFIDQLPQGFDTHLGEKGVRLSGGQRQRIAIARALLKDPKILLLDEATSALDAESEQLVQQAMKTLMQDRTTIVIAHRLSTVLEADRIVVLENGRIETIGKHKELLKRGGTYARLAKLQFAD